MEIQITSKWLQIIPLKLPTLFLQIWRSHFMNSLSCLKFLNLKYFKWNSNHFQTPFHFFKWKISYYLHSRVLWWKEFEFMEIINEGESLGKSFYSLSFNFQKVSNFSQSITQVSNNQSNLSIYYNIPKFRILGCYKPTTLKMNIALEIRRG